MISNKAIESIYKKYGKRPASVDELNIPLLFDANEAHAIEINDTDLIINSIEKWSPFHSINLTRVHAILDLERYVALVLHSSILFIGKQTDEIHIHIKPIKPSIMDRIRNTFNS